VEYPVGPWVRERFGERAAHVCVALVDALHQALTDARDAQKISKAKLLFPFGSTQATRRYECIVDALKEMDGAQLIKPKGSPHKLVLLNGNLIYPFRYAKDGSVPIQRARVTEEKVSGLVAELFAFYGPEQQQPSLFDPSGDDAAETDRVPVLTALPEGTRLALLAYASNDRAGVLNAWLGEGELGLRGHVHWLPGRYQQLPLGWPASGGGESRGYGPSGPFGPLPGPRPSDPAGPTASPTAGSRFDDGAMPAVPLTTRASVEREHSERFPPAMEQALQKPKTDDAGR